MTAEETELTFIRCPSCRSLVPAVAARCRMCGHHFAAEEDENAEVGEAAPRKSRVRQRTISVSKDDIDPLDLAAGSEREPEPASRVYVDDEDVEEEHNTPPAEPHEEYLAETPEPAEQEARSEKQFLSRPGWAMEKSFDAEEEVEAAPAEPAEEPRAVHARDDEEENADFESTEDSSADDEEDDADSDESISANFRPEGRKRRRRRRRRRGGGQPLEPLGALSHDAEPEVEFQAEPEATSRPEPLTSETIRETRESRMASSESSIHDGNPGRAVPQQNLRPREHVHTSEEGALVGWLVNFDQDAKGVAGEIRSGKYFIARQRLRKTDLVIPDSAVSTPHCLVAASRDGLKVQDLMSEQGTYIKKKGSDSFSQVFDAVNVEHGDWLRFGGYEVLICLIPSSGRK